MHGSLPCRARFYVGDGRGVLEKWNLPGVKRSSGFARAGLKTGPYNCAAWGEQAAPLRPREELLWSGGGELAEVGDEVRLVVVAGGGGRIAP